MKKYFFPAGTLRSYSRELSSLPSNTLPEFQAQLAQDEVLVGHYRIVEDEHKMVDQAPELVPEQFVIYEHLVSIGKAVCLGYFAVPKDVIKRFSGKQQNVKSGFC